MDLKRQALYNLTTWITQATVFPSDGCYDERNHSSLLQKHALSNHLLVAYNFIPMLVVLWLRFIAQYKFI